MKRFWLGIGLVAAMAEAQEPSSNWNLRSRFEIKANYRDTNHDRFQLRSPFPPSFQPPVFLETVDQGSNVEASAVSLVLDIGYRELFAARAKIDAIDLYDRNPTSDDHKVDADELWIRFGQKPEGLQLPATPHTLFAQIGKAPKMERQPVRLLESYGLASTAFNRFEDTQLLVGGSIATNFYWRAQVSNGNPLFFRDPNALAGDNGTEARRPPNPAPRLKSGFPILYDAEVEDLFFDTDTMEIGGGIGYRWRTEDESIGFDALVFHYQRELQPTVELHGTFYGGDLDLLDGALGIPLPFEGNEKRESGARLYAELKGLSLVAQYIDDSVAELERTAYEIEIGYELSIALGPAIRGAELVSSLQPAARFSLLDCHFRGPATFVAPSVWWDWEKIDAGIRIGLLEKHDLTIEHQMHDIKIAVDLDVDETLVTLRLRF